MIYSKPYRLLGGLLFAAVLLLSGGLAVAQEFRGTILGRITDPSGAAVPGVQITVTNEKTNVSSNAVSEDDGAYQVPFLIPGAYRLEVGAAGFNEYVQSGITVAVGQRVTVNVAMKVGQVSETVTVAANRDLAGDLDRRDGAGDRQNEGRVYASQWPHGLHVESAAEGVIWQIPTFGATGTSGLRPFDNLGGSAWSMNGGRLPVLTYSPGRAPQSTRGWFNFSRRWMWCRSSRFRPTPTIHNTAEPVAAW